MSNTQAKEMAKTIHAGQRKPLEIDSYVALRLKVLRVLNGVSQEQLGQKLGITFQQVQKYEKGTNRITAGRLYEVARIFSVSVNYFFEGYDDSICTSVHEDTV